tara:strand:- start:257 stop:712 length:456 start_codon:yes stop_codon:yes gene_type:complete
MVGDVEVYSGSRNEAGIVHVDFSNPKAFLNREIRDKGKGYKYKSFMHTTNSVDNPGIQDGRPVGRTSYFATSSDGSAIYYPPNHYVFFTDDFSNKHYKGTQNTNPGFLNVKNYEDYSSASFYRVKVTGDNVLRPNYGKYVTTPSSSIERMK